MFFCGIDVAKRNHAVALLDEHGQLVQRPFSIENTRAGFDQLLQALAQLPGGPVVIGLEATGHYWLALYEDLTQRAIRWWCSTPCRSMPFVAVACARSRVIATMPFGLPISCASPTCPPPARRPPCLLQLRELTRFRSHLTDQIGDCKRKLLCILDRVFPEYETLFSSVFLTSSRLCWPRPPRPRNSPTSTWPNSPTCSKDQPRPLRRTKAEAIQHAAQQSVGVRFLVDAVRVEMRCLLDQIDLLEEQVDQIDDALAALMAQIPQHITSIPGIGPVTGAAILAEIGDISPLRCAEKLVAYAGIDPSVYQTGQFQASRRI